MPDELDELTRVAHALPQFMALQGRVVLQFSNACTSTSTLMDRPVVGVPAYADVLQVSHCLGLRLPMPPARLEVLLTGCALLKPFQAGMLPLPVG